MIEYLLFSGFMMLFASGVSFIIAAFSSLLGTTSYTVADKKNVAKKKDGE